MSEIDKLVKAITKQFGAGSAFRMSSMPDTGVIGWTSTGCVAINNIIGRPGIPHGRVTTILGPPSGAKTTLVTHIMAEHQKIGGTVLYWPTEYSYDPTRAKRIGLDISNVILGYPETCENAFETLKLVANNTNTSSPPVLIVWDTFSATPLQSEVYGTGQGSTARENRGELETETSMGGHALGEHARLVSREMRICQGPISTKNITFVVVLQSKMKIGVQFGSGITYLAERPWYFYSNVQLETKRVSNVKDGSSDTAEIIGIRVKVSCRKNKVAPPFKECEVDCLFEDGLDDAEGLLEKAIFHNFVKIAGKGRFTYTAGDGSEVKFTRRGRKGYTWKDVLSVPGMRNYIEGLGGQSDVSAVTTEE